MEKVRVEPRKSIKETSVYSVPTLIVSGGERETQEDENEPGVTQ